MAKDKTLKVEDLNTGHDVIKYAKQKNAHIEPAGNFTAIETRQGKMHIKDSNEKMDKRTKSNTRKWLELLGLGIFLFLCVYPLLVNVILPKVFG